MRILIIKTFLIFILLGFTQGGAEENPELGFLVSDKRKEVLKLYELKNRLDSHTIRINDPIYGKEKTYRAFRLGEVLDLVYGDEWKNEEYSDISFHAKDGYEAVSDISKMKEGGGYLVFRDMEYENWEPIGDKKADPSPFYIVWEGNNQKAENGYPWPWQLDTINLILFRNQYPEIYPQGVSEDSTVYKGFEIFKQRCVRCHSINRQGGKVGPDLNAPMNVLQYRPSNMVKEFIKHPSKYRYTHMPDNPDLSDIQLQNIIDYLWFKNKREKK